MPQRTCGTSGCPNAHRARGLCSSCYNRQYTPDRRWIQVEVPCTWCGRVALKPTTRRYGNRFCSLACRDTWRRRDKLPILFVGELRPFTPASPRQPQPRQWTAGRCKRCRIPFVDRQPDARYCSTRCGRRYSRDQRKGEVPHATRMYVLERDGWRCLICKRGIPALLTVPHHMAGTVDHIVPRSQGGTHDPANLRAAHFICNTVRSNRGGNEQLALLG